MSVRLSSSRWWLGVALMVWTSLPVYRTHGEDKAAGQPVARPDQGKSSQVVTNVPRLGMKKDGLRQLEEDLARSLGGFKPGIPSEGDPAARPARLQPGPAIQNKRARDQKERRKNWVFMSPEDPGAGLSVEDLFNIPGYGPDGQEKNHLSPLELFYQNLDRRYSGKAESKPFAEKDPFGMRKETAPRDAAGSSEDANLPKGVKDTEQRLKRLLGADATGLTPARTHGTLSDIFGLGDQNRSPEQELAHKAYMREYQRWLEAPTVAAGTGPANILGTTASSGGPASYSSGPGALSIPAHSPGPAPRVDFANPALAVGTLPDVNAKVLNQWNSMYTPPKIELPKTVAPPPPPSEVPRRKF
jgi:hypothetical protein